jgi:hypothetical protein
MRAKRAERASVRRFSFLAAAGRLQQRMLREDDADLMI